MKSIVHRALFALIILSTLRAMPLHAGTIPWTQFQGDARHSGHVPIFVDPQQIAPLWSVTDTSIGQTDFVNGVATDDDHVYVTSRSGSSRTVWALNRASGATEWNESFVPFASSGLSQPTTGNGKVYVHEWGHSGVSGGNPSQHPKVIGLNAADGNQLFATNHAGQWSSGSRPTVVDNQVFAAGGYFGGMDAYNATSGANQWFSNVNQQYGWIPATNDTHVYCYMRPASASPGPPIGSLYGINRTTGNRDITIQNPLDSGAGNGTVYMSRQELALVLTGGNTISAFDLNTLTVGWRKSGGYRGTLALDDNLVFARTQTQVHILDEVDGTLLDQWTAPTGEILDGNLIVTENLIFAQSDDKTFAIDRTSLMTVWSANVAGDLALDGHLLLISNDDTLHAYLVPEPTSALLVLMVMAHVTSRRRRGATRAG